MMNHQGGMSHLNCNANNQSKVNHQLIQASELIPTASSFTAGDHRFPDQVSRSNHAGYNESLNNFPNNDRSAAAFPHESSEVLRFSPLTSLSGNVRRFPDGLSGSSDLHSQASNSIIPSIGHSAVVVPQNVDSGAEYAGNNYYNDLNLSLSLGPHSSEQENQNTSSSCTTVIDLGRSSSAVQEQGLDSSSVNMRRLSCKRKSSEHAIRELLVGESSSSAAQTGFSKRWASEVHGNNGLNICTPCTSPVSHQERSETIIGHSPIGPVSDVQHLNGARLSENFRSNIHLHTTASQQTFLPTSILSSGYRRDTHIQLPSQSPLYGQVNHPPFFRSAESSINPLFSVQPDGHVPIFHETPQATPWINMMRPSSVFSSFLPVNATVESDAVAPFHYPRHITENIMLSRQIGVRNWVHDARNSHFVNGAANFHGDFFCPLHGCVSGIIHSENAPTWFSGFSFADRYMQTPSRIVNHPVLATTGFPWLSHSPADSDLSAVLQELRFAVGFVNTVSQNQHASGARSENHAAFNFTWSLANARNRMRLRPENLHASEARPENQDDSYYDHLYHSFWSPANAANRRRLSIELHHRLAHMRSEDPLQPVMIPLELRMLDHSIIMDILQEHANVDGLHFDLDDWTNEDLAALAEPIEAGLSEEMILSHLRQEKFHLIPAGSEESECCCICQEEYRENEDLGKLCCAHRFHVDCIKPWLELKNICPICKQVALPLFLDSP
ncbi:E3 ubiquitin-protein ligase MBR2-like isoform X2 [Prosopis cineraria]|uniref:E3 ubiquitin-protein ligase MBR2-like isoform X2 n=1 Tax=Prosopis cineraria TaxID=364024 RepID=UPI0024100560|nr:E3 ubiquitin-protein ligase MBR2-like isoform X2 [Prosopis cineraria]